MDQIAKRPTSKATNFEVYLYFICIWWRFPALCYLLLRLQVSTRSPSSKRAGTFVQEIDFHLTTDGYMDKARLHRQVTSTIRHCQQICMPMTINESQNPFSHWNSLSFVSTNRSWSKTITDLRNWTKVLLLAELARGGPCQRVLSEKCFLPPTTFFTNFSRAKQSHYYSMSFLRAHQKKKENTNKGSKICKLEPWHQKYSDEIVYYLNIWV